MKNVDEFATQAADTAMLAAAARVARGGVPTRELLADAAGVDRLLVLIREELSTAVPAALADAREACAAGMGVQASMTFTASMRLAGVRAAERWLADRVTA